jgi:hypothetical protein
MFGGGGAGHPPEPKPAPTADDPETAKARSQAEAEQRMLSKRRKGARSTRLTDPIVELTSRPGAANPSTTDRPKRSSILGGGEYPA